MLVKLERIDIQRRSIARQNGKYGPNTQQPFQRLTVLTLYDPVQRLHQVVHIFHSDEMNKTRDPLQHTGQQTQAYFVVFPSEYAEVDGKYRLNDLGVQAAFQLFILLQLIVLHLFFHFRQFLDRATN